MRSFSTALFSLAALAAGFVLPFQAVINAKLRGVLGDPIRAAFVQFIVGTLFLFVLTLTTREAWPTSAQIAERPWWIWVGGFLGAAYITSTIFALPRLGAAVTFGLIVAGQMVASLAIDQAGLFGVPPTSINLTRLAGAALLIAGVVLIRR